MPGHFSMEAKAKVFFLSSSTMSGMTTLTSLITNRALGWRIRAMPNNNTGLA